MLWVAAMALLSSCLVPFGMSNVVLGASETEDAVPRQAAGIDKHRPAPGAAQLWVDPSGGSCVRRSNPAPWVDARACRSLWAAYKTARSGDIINITDGTYTSQTLGGGTKRILFRAAGPGRPRFGQIVSAASDVTLRGVAIEARDIDANPRACSGPDNAILYPCGARQTFANVVIDGLNGRSTNVHGIRGVGEGFVLKNSEVRNIVDNKGFEGGAVGMVFDHNYWHDIRATNELVHNECAYVDGGDRQVWRRNRFVGCPTMALFFTNWSGGPAYRDVVVENNMFGHTLDDEQKAHVGCAVVLGAGADGQNTFVGWTVRYNTFETCVYNVGSSGTSDDNGSGRWYGNLGGGWGCVPEFFYHHNVGTACGPTDLAVSPHSNDSTAPNRVTWYINAAAADLHLKPHVAAIGRGDPGDFPSTDIDGQRRPIGRTPDAGADEAG